MRRKFTRTLLLEPATLERRKRSVYHPQRFRTMRVPSRERQRHRVQIAMYLQQDFLEGRFGWYSQLAGGNYLCGANRWFGGR